MEDRRTDEELVRSALEGDQDAYELLYGRSMAYTVRSVKRVLRARPWEDAEAVAHDALARAFLGLSKFRGGACTFRSWLTRIAINSALGILREAKRRPVSQPPKIDRDTGASKPLDPPFDPRTHEVLEARQLAARMIGGLGVEDQAILTEVMGGERLSDVAARTGRSESAEKARRYRALRRAKGVLVDIEEKACCADCARVGRFRFADTVVDGKALCKWCSSAGRPAAEVKWHKDGRKPTWTKVCRCCGATFETTSSSQQYIEGHRPSGQYRRPTAALALTAPVVPAEGAAFVSLRLPAAALDRLWTGLALADKARAIEVLLGGGGAG